MKFAKVTGLILIALAIVATINAPLLAWTKEKPIRVPRGDFEQEAPDFLLRVRTAANEREAAK